MIHAKADPQIHLCPACNGYVAIDTIDEATYTLRERGVCDDCGATVVFAYILFACYTEADVFVADTEKLKTTIDAAVQEAKKGKEL